MSPQVGTQVVVVTGAARGIGAGTAVELAAGGHHVLAVDRDRQALEDLVDAHGARGLAGCTADVTVAADVARVGRSAGSLGTVVAWVNNAGVGHAPRALSDTPPHELERMLLLNLGSQLLGCREAARLLGRGGSIVNIGSRSWLGAPGNVDYSAAKGGVVSLTRSLALELAPMGIRVNAVVPGTIETPALAALPAEDRASLAARHPAGRFGQVEDVARVVRWLVAETSRTVTGQSLHVCGGRSIDGAPRIDDPTSTEPR